jgi:hypothetical protein
MGPMAKREGPTTDLGDVDEPDDTEMGELATDIDVELDDEDVLDDADALEEGLDEEALDPDLDIDEDADDSVAEPDVEEDVAAIAVDDEEEEEEDDDDVEAGLDVILKDRLVAPSDDDEEDEPADPEERTEGATKVLPKRPGEFVCQSCFLVKHPSQLADPDRGLCRDCV